MRYVKPHYFDEFCCMADRCPDTCCAGWQIVIDEEALERYSREQGDWGQWIAGAIDWQEGCFKQYAGRCAFLDEKNLCELVRRKGETYLCETCRRYPRHVEEFEDLREWSLSLSCPVAAGLILTREEPVRFLVEEDDLPDPLEEEFEEFDLLLFTKLEDAREWMFAVAQDRSIPMVRRMGRVLELAEELQKCVDEGRLWEMDEVIGRGYREPTCEDAVFYGEDKPDSEAFEKGHYASMKEAFGVFSRLELLREDWSQVLQQTEECLYFDTPKEYHRIRQDFLEQYGPGGPEYEAWEIFQENLFLFFLYTYFCGGVYDEWIYSKAALAVFSVSFLQEFVMCRRYLADKTCEPSEWVELACRYAREVEHSDDNLNFLEEWLMESGLIMKGMVTT
ncbi:MAG: flagellin lysine-N-methylase [Lachnospiraceae bacterium]|nr:flagellin lysine-N-methylase [Lachnospiraceae bacterium]